MSQTESMSQSPGSQQGDTAGCPSPTSSHQSFGPKKRKRDLVGEIPDSQLDTDQLAKRIRRRELNKQAARQSRARKQSRIEELEMRVRQLNERNRALELTLQERDSEKRSLMAVLRSHGLSLKTVAATPGSGRVVTTVLSVVILAAALSDKVLESATHEAVAATGGVPDLATFSATALPQAQKQAHFVPTASVASSVQAEAARPSASPSARLPTAPLTLPATQFRQVAAPTPAPQSQLPRVSGGCAVKAYPRNWISSLPPSHAPTITGSALSVPTDQPDPSPVPSPPLDSGTNPSLSSPECAEVFKDFGSPTDLMPMMPLEGDCADQLLALDHFGDEVPLSELGPLEDVSPLLAPETAPF